MRVEIDLTNERIDEGGKKVVKKLTGTVEFLFTNRELQSTESIANAIVEMMKKK